MPYVYSTLTCDNLYVDFDFVENAYIRKGRKQVLINGGANLPKAGMKSIITPLGAVTEVSDDDLTFLEGNESFKAHVKNGFIKVDKSKVKIKEAVKTMQDKDESSPKKLKDLEKLKVKEYNLDTQ